MKTTLIDGDFQNYSIIYVNQVWQNVYLIDQLMFHVTTEAG